MENGKYISSIEFSSHDDETNNRKKRNSLRHNNNKDRRKESIKLESFRIGRRGTNAFEASLGIHRGSTLLEDFSRPITPVFTKDEETRRNFLESMSRKRVKKFSFVDDNEEKTKRLSIKYPLNIENINNKLTSLDMLDNLFEQSRRRRRSRLFIEKKNNPQCLLAKVSKRVTAVNKFLSSLANLRLLRGTKHHQCSLKVLIWMTVYTKRIAEAMAETSYNLTPKTAAMSAWEHIGGNRQTYDYEFNRDDFKQASTKAALYLPEWVMKILDKPINERTQDDVKKLNSAVSMLCNFSEKFTYSVRTAMCKTFGYLKVGGNRVVLRSGHVGHNFYLIYSGSVFINRQEFDQNNMKNIWRTVNVLERGDSFGEIALLRDNSSRRATVVTREETEFLIVPREVFATICPQALDKELSVKLKATRSMNLFENWTERNLRNLCVDAKVYHIPANRVAVDETVNLRSALYVCLEGQCSVIKKLELKNENGQFLMENNSSDPLHFYKSQPDPYFVSKFNREMRDMVLLPDNDDLNDFGESINGLDISQRFTETYKENDFIDSKKLPKRITLNIPSKFHSNQQQHTEVVYMCVADLNAADVFNLNEFFSGTYEKVILMSRGCKLIRFNRNEFLDNCTRKNLQEAKFLAELHRYTTGHTLLEAYTNTIKWREYKEKTINNVINKRNNKKESNLRLPNITQTSCRKKPTAQNTMTSAVNLEEIIQGRNPEFRISKKARYSLTGNLLSKF